jgi:hypothetical protein
VATAADPDARLTSKAAFSAGHAGAISGLKSNVLDSLIRSGWIYEGPVGVRPANQRNNGRNVTLRHTVDMAHGVPYI